MQGVPAKEAPEADMDAESRVAKPLYVGAASEGTCPYRECGLAPVRAAWA